MEKKKYNAPKVKIAVMEKIMAGDGVSTLPSDGGGDSRGAKQNPTLDDGKETTSTWDN